MNDFYLPPKQDRTKRPYGLTSLQVELLQQLANGKKCKELVTATRNERCITNMAYHMRLKMNVLTTPEATAKGVREGIIK